MVATFTSGPWIVDDEEFGENGDYTEPRVFSCVDEYNPKIICSLAVRSGMEANAQLIAAAPDLYKALQALRQWTQAEIDYFDGHSPDDFIWDKVNSALAKAGGKKAQS